MERRKIFVSCGQVTDDEKALGRKLKELVDSIDRFEAYFAQEVQDLEALGHNIFQSLSECVGAIAILQPRGNVSFADTQWGIRSSVWINQELAILAYRQFLEARKIPIRVFKHPDVKLEGAMTAQIVNPRPFDSDEDVLEDVREWLSDPDTPFISIGSIDRFNDKWEHTSDEGRLVVACLLEEGDGPVTFDVLSPRMREKYEFDRPRAHQVLSKAINEFRQTNLVTYISDRDGRRLAVNPTWKGHLIRAIAKWESS